MIQYRYDRAARPSDAPESHTPDASRASRCFQHIDRRELGLFRLYCAWSGRIQGRELPYPPRVSKRETEMKKFAAMVLIAALAVPSASIAQQPHRPEQGQRDRNDRQPQHGQDHRGPQPERPNNSRQPGNHGQGNGKFYADQHYRDGANYRPTRITRNTRIYRGSNGRYYCRRSDGTTGLIAGVAIGAILGNRLGDGDSALLSTILGAGAGGVLGREIDRGNVQCR